MTKIFFFFCTLLGLLPLGAKDPIRIGLIGLDTSHVTAFTKIINDPTTKDHVPGAKVVAAFKGGSPDIESSISRVDGYTKTLREDFGVEICETIENLCTKVDAVMIESVDGRPHLEQARPVIAAGKPLFIDKPVAGSLREALEALSEDRAFLKKGEVFSDDLIDAYIDLKMEEVFDLEHSPHPIEFVNYYSV